VATDCTEAAQRAEPAQRVRVALADDDVLLREGLASLLERSGFELVGQAGDADGLLALVREHAPELAVVDIRMPPTHTTEGLDAARAIRAEFPRMGILVLSAHVEIEHAVDLLGGGEGIGYLLKRRVTDVGDFLDTLERVANGGSVVDPALVQDSWPRAAPTTRSRTSRRVSARSSARWPRGGRTRASRAACG
jgi:DNA-binding NarL/FixJ family response regulator